MHILKRFMLHSVPVLSGILGYENNWIYQNLRQIPVVRLGRTLRLTRFDIETFIRSIYSGNIDEVLAYFLNSRFPQIPREARILNITQVADVLGSQRSFVLKCIHELGLPRYHTDWISDVQVTMQDLVEFILRHRVCDQPDNFPVPDCFSTTGDRS